MSATPPTAEFPADAAPPHAGERPDFDALYQRHSREVWALVYARCMNSHTALDIAQEAFLRYWRESEAGEPILNPRAWLLRVARNLAEDHAKSAFRRNGTQGPATMAGVMASDDSPLDRMEREETNSRVREVLGLMPEPDREVLTLRYALEYDTERIAELLGINTTAVHMRLSRARQRLAERLKAQGIGQLP